jgi:hypothetical protein
MAQGNTFVKELKTVDEELSRVGGSTQLVAERATAPAVIGDSGASLFERLARDPGVDPDKLERLMALWERTEAMRAESAFNVAMSKAQDELRPVSADAENPQTRSKYASYAALDRAVRPVYAKHGFALSFDTADSPLPEHIRVVCYVTQSGCKRTYRVDMPSDGKGAKGGDVMTKTHAAGAALSYGQRYLLKLIFNIAVGEDRDGNKPKVESSLPVPVRFDDWWDDMQATAANGLNALKKAFNESKPEYRIYLTKTRGPAWELLKSKAAKVVTK